MVFPSRHRVIYDRADNEIQVDPSFREENLSNAIASVVVAFASLSVGREKEEKYPADSYYYESRLVICALAKIFSFLSRIEFVRSYLCVSEILLFSFFFTFRHLSLILCCGCCI